LALLFRNRFEKNKQWSLQPAYMRLEGLQSLRESQPALLYAIMSGDVMLLLKGTYKSPSPM
jgi:hypothetical protein